MRRKARKFEITGKPSPHYEDLVNDPMVEIIDIDKFSNFGSYFVVVHYYDLNPRRANEEVIPDEPDTSSSSEDSD